MFKNAILKPFLLGTKLRLVRKSLLALLEILQLSSDSSSASRSLSVLSIPSCDDGKHRKIRISCLLFKDSFVLKCLSVTHFLLIKR